jgi:transposase-like protein
MIKSKPILGFRPLNTDLIFFSDEEKIAIIEEYLSSGQTKNAIWKKYTGRDHEHGTILKWMRTFGYEEASTASLTNKFRMKKDNQESYSTDTFENAQLKKRIEELESKLKDAEMKAIAYSTMIDIAEDEFKLKIRKKFNTKPFKK